ncbi:MAG: RNA polymerase sigma factor [Deltaproteobacteria bacterium]|nr:RNA polymerase sigma factor [Deltaproteobacteria bacterium]
MTTKPHRHDLSELVRRSVDGSSEAVHQLVCALQTEVYAVALRMLWNRADAEDATQGILVRVVTRLSQFDGRSRLRTWVFRLAVNYLLDVKKSRVERWHMTFERFGDDLLDGLSDVGPAKAERSWLVEEVKVGCTLAMLQCLDRPHRLAYILAEILGLPTADAAEALDIEPAALRKRLQRSRERVEAFTAVHCGLVSETAACGCNRRVPPAVHLGRVRADAIDFARAETSFAEARAAVQRLDHARRSLEIFRSCVRRGFRPGGPRGSGCQAVDPAPSLRARAMQVLGRARLNRRVQHADDHGVAQTMRQRHFRVRRVRRVEPLAASIPAVEGFAESATSDGATLAELRFQLCDDVGERHARRVGEDVDFEEALLRVDPCMGAAGASDSSGVDRHFDVAPCTVPARTATAWCHGAPRRGHHGLHGVAPAQRSVGHSAQQGSRLANGGGLRRHRLRSRERPNARTGRRPVASVAKKEESGPREARQDQESHRRSRDRDWGTARAAVVVDTGRRRCCRDSLRVHTGHLRRLRSRGGLGFRRGLGCPGRRRPRLRRKERTHLGSRLRVDLLCLRVPDHGAARAPAIAGASAEALEHVQLPSIEGQEGVQIKYVLLPFDSEHVVQWRRSRQRHGLTLSIGSRPRPREQRHAQPRRAARRRPERGAVVETQSERRRTLNHCEQRGFCFVVGDLRPARIGAGMDLGVAPSHQGLQALLQGHGSRPRRVLRQHLACEVAQLRRGLIQLQSKRHRQ